MRNKLVFIKVDCLPNCGLLLPVLVLVRSKAKDDS